MAPARFTRKPPAWEEKVRQAQAIHAQGKVLLGAAYAPFASDVLVGGQVVKAHEPAVRQPELDRDGPSTVRG